MKLPFDEVDTPLQQQNDPTGLESNDMDYLLDRLGASCDYDRMYYET